MAVAVWTSFQQITDSNGVPYSGAKINVYAAGTTTPLTLYSDEDLQNSADNPIVCDSSGQHPMRYIATASYKTSITTSSGTPLTNWSKDDIDPGVAVGSGALPVANGGTGATTAGAARTNLGAASDATVTSIASDVTTLQSYHSGTSALPIAKGTTAQRSGSPTAYDIRGNTTLESPEMYLNGTWHKISIAPPVAGSFKGLVVQNNSGTPNSRIDIDADSVVVQTTGGVAARLDTIDLTIDCTTIGANGLDAGALANSTWYYHFVIYNPSTGTTAGLSSVSATNPTMPSGYTFKARVGAHITNSSAVFHRILQKGRRAQYVVSSATTTALPIIISGANGNAGTPTWIAASVTGIVPSSATKINVVLTNQSASGATVAPNNLYGTNISITNPPPIHCPSSATEIKSTEMVLESTNIYYACAGSNAACFCLGWEDSI